MISHPLYLATLFAASTSIVAASPSSPPTTGGNLTRRNPFSRLPLLDAKGRPNSNQHSSSAPAFKKGSSSTHSSKVDSKWGRTAAIRRRSVPLGGVTDMAAPVLAALGPLGGDSDPSTLPVTPSSYDSDDSDDLPVLAALPGSSPPAAAPRLSSLAGLLLPLVKRADALASLLSGNAAAAAVAPLVQNVPITALTGNSNSPVANLAAPLVNLNQPAVNILSPGATTNQVTAENYAPNGTIVDGNSNRVSQVVGDGNKVVAGDKNSDLVQGDKNQVVQGHDNDGSFRNGITKTGGSTRGRSGGQRTVGKVVKHSSSSSSGGHSSSSSSSGSSRAVHGRKNAYRAKVAKTAKGRAPSHSIVDDADEDLDRDCTLTAPAATQTRTRTLYKTVTRTVVGPTPTARQQHHLLDLDASASIKKIVKAVADVEIL